MTLATDPRRPDLGGNVRGGDCDTWCPEVWQALLEQFHPTSVLDVGCGEGHAVKWFWDNGIAALGVDGLYDNMRNAAVPHSVVHCDLTERPFLFPVDLVWCSEVAEHIEEKHLDNLLTTLCNGEIIAMTHALPGQQGHHHVNLQPAEYWIGHICDRGYEALDPMPFRALVTDRKNYFSNSGLIFRRCPAR